MVCFANFDPDWFFDPDWASFKFCVNVFPFLLSGWYVGIDWSYVRR